MVPAVAMPLASYLSPDAMHATGRTICADAEIDSVSSDAVRDFHVALLGLAWLRAALTEILEAASPSVEASAARAAYDATRASLRARHTPAAIDRLSRLFGLA